MIWEWLWNYSRQIQSWDGWHSSKLPIEHRWCAKRLPKQEKNHPSRPNRHNHPRLESSYDLLHIWWPGIMLCFQGKEDEIVHRSATARILTELLSQHIPVNLGHVPRNAAEDCMACPTISACRSSIYQKRLIFVNWIGLSPSSSSNIIPNYSCWKLGEDKLLYFVWSPPWHLYIFLLANLLAFYLTYLLAFYLAYLLAYVLAYLLAFYLANLLAFYLTYLLAFYLAYLLACSGISSGILSGKSSGILSGISSGILSDISFGILSGISSGILSGRWGPAVPTGIWSSRLRSGSAHWDLELAVEVRQCPLGSGARGWGPAVPTATWKSRLRSGTAICNSRLRSGSAHWDLELAVEVRLCPLTGIWTTRRRRRVRRRRRQRRRRRGRRRRRALLKSSNPHLAGGEKPWNY